MFWPLHATYLSLGGSSLITKKMGQKFCLFEDLNGETPSVLKEKRQIEWIIFAEEATRMH